MEDDRDVRIAAAVWTNAARDPLTLKILPGWENRIWLPPVGKGPGELVNRREHGEVLEMLRTDAIFRQEVADVLWRRDRNPERALHRATVVEEYIRSFRGTPSSTWKRILDKESRKYYYWNTATDEVTWTAPAYAT